MNGDIIHDSEAMSQVLPGLVMQSGQPNESESQKEIHLGMLRTLNGSSRLDNY